MPSSQNGSQSKLNLLLSHWPQGAVLTLAYLKEMGFSKQLMDKYKAGRWVASVGNGAYRRYQDSVDWLGGLHGLQAAGLAVHAGAKTALEMLGLAHYLGPRMPRCFLLAQSGLRLPMWFKGYDWETQVLFRPTRLFQPSPDLGFTEHAHRGFMVRIASAERAALEMMHLVPDVQGFDEAYRIMENLTSLRPDLVQRLLESCQSIKAKRLFLMMAERAGHDWVDELDLKTVHLGTGKRVIVKDGVLNKKYQITVEAESGFLDSSVNS